MSNWWVTNYADAAGMVFVVSWIVWVIISIVLHELAHGWVAIRCGDDVPLHSGHMTWNPLVHMPFPWAWIMFAVFGYTWGLMPTNPANYRGRYDEAKVAFAGPAMNLLLFVVCVVAEVLWLTYARGVADPLHLNFHKFLFVGATINLMGFCFNLVPVPPLDGARILANVVPAYDRMWSKLGQSHMGGIVAMIAFAFLFFVGSSVLWNLVFTGTTLGIRLPVGLLGGEFRSPLA